MRDKERQVGRHLIVSRAARVKLAAERADDLRQPALDRHMDVLVIGVKLEGLPRELSSHLLEAAEHLPELVIGQDLRRLSASAWATDPAMSCGQRRRSKPTEVLIRLNSGSWG